VPQILPPGSSPKINHVAVLPLTAVQFRATGPEEDPYSKILGPVEIGGVMHHVEGFRVTERRLPSLVEGEETFGEQVCDGPEEVESYYAELANAFGGDGPFGTVPLDGRDYVLFISPHCQ
jgi:hypothetical protein